MKKTECPVSRQEFRDGAKDLTIVVKDAEGNQQTLTIPVKEFSTGSFGWYLSDKMKVRVGDVDVKCQVGLNLTVIGSKEAEAV